MKKLHPVLLCTLIALLSAVGAWGQMRYTFRAGSGSGIEMGAAAVVINGWAQAGNGQGGFDDEVVTSQPIGFTFKFDGVEYTEFSLSSNGVIGLGANSVTEQWDNTLNGSEFYPVIAPFWDDLRVSGGVQGCGRPQVSYLLTGDAPNRVLVVEFQDIDLIRFSPRWGTFQVRLYEGSNAIEFYYEKMNPCDGCNQGYGCDNTSASIGLASAPGRSISITPNGADAFVSFDEPNDGVDVLNTPISENTLYVFVPCDVQTEGLIGPDNGGTLTLEDGDTFFDGVNVQMGSSKTFTPFKARLSDPLCEGQLEMSISGPAAADYYFGTPGNNFMVADLSGGVIHTAAITFEPTATGVRNATLTVTNGTTYTRTFNLAAYSPNLIYTGHVAEGGTETMASGDHLLEGMKVDRFTSRDFMPFTLTNVSGDDLAITYTLNDPTGQYSITPNVTIGANESTTPTITFSPTGFGPQSAELTVEAAGESRTFTLNAISAAPGGELTTGGVAISSSSTFFTNTFTCSGEQATSIPVTIRNTGYGDFVINGIEFFQIDTTYAQGRPSYPFVRDGQGNLVPSIDYALTTTANAVPNESNRVTFPIVLPEGASQVVYLTFSSQRPDKRFARVYISTNGQSFSSADPNGEMIEGLLSFDVFGRGTGSRLSDNIKGGLPKPVFFRETHVGTTQDTFFVIFNPGVCPLRVNLSEMAIDEGDADEFSITRKPSSNIDGNTGDLLLPPGSSDTVWVRFRPRQMGSRRAGLRLMTNDSTIQIPGLTERGTYYLDLFGQGKADVYAEDVDFGQALIGGTGIELVHKGVRLKNTLNGPIVITKILFEGGDMGEFTQDNGTTWPQLPYVINGGQEVNLGVVFGPVAGGQPGPRTTMLKFITANGDTIIARLTGIAGVRTAAVTPGTANFGPVTIGKMVRKAISIMNSGTMPLTLGSPTLSPGSDFSIGTLPRTVLAPGQTEYLEVTYTPQTAGGSTATLEIPSNATNGPLQVTLNGTAQKTKLVIDDPSSATRGNAGGELSERDELNVSGVTGEEIAGGMALFQSVPNPARDQVEIGYRVATAGEVRLELYDGAGRLVKVLDAGFRAAGEQRVRVDVRDLASGLYHYRLTADGHSISRGMTVTR